MDPFYAAFGHLVRDARKKSGLTQEELGRLIGLTRTSVANIEAGRQKALLDTVYRIAGAVGASPSDLLPDAPPDEGSIDLPPQVDTQRPEVQQWILDVVEASDSAKGKNA